MIHHLLSNAVNFSENNTKINLFFSKDESNLWFRCVDNGIGIAKEDREKIFKPFVTLKEADAFSTPSAGLGLYVCKNICEKLGGLLIIENDVDPTKGVTAFLAKIHAEEPKPIFRRRRQP